MKSGKDTERGLCGAITSCGQKLIGGLIRQNKWSGCRIAGKILKTDDFGLQSHLRFFPQCQSFCCADGSKFDFLRFVLFLYVITFPCGHYSNFN